MIEVGAMIIEEEDQPLIVTKEMSLDSEEGR